MAGMTLQGWLTNTKALQLFQVMRQGGAILTAILLAYSGLSTEQVGQYEMLLYIGYLLSFAWVSGLVQSLLAYFPRQTDEGKSELITESWLAFLGLSILFGGLLLLFPAGTLKLLTQNTAIPYAGLFAGFLIANWPATLQEHFYLLQNRPKAIAVYGMWSIGAQFMAVVVPPLLGWSFYWSFVGLLAVGLVKFGWLMTFVLRYGRFGNRLALRRGWLLAAWPLVGYALLGALNVSFDPWFVGYFYEGDESVFAIYRYGAREVPFVMALAGAFSSAVIPTVGLDLPQGLRDIRNKSRRLFHLLFPVSILLMLTSRWWFVWVFSERFADSVVIFNVLLLLTANHLIFSRTVLVGLQDTKRLLWFAGGSILLNILLSILLAPVYGLMGIALATVIAYAAEKVAMFIYVRLRHGISLRAYTDLRWWGLYTLLLLLAFGVQFL